MSIPEVNFKTYLTTGSAGTGDASEAQNTPDDSLGKYASTTEVSATIGNLFESYSPAQLTSSTRYRCIALKMDHASANVVTPKLVAQFLPSLKSGMVASYGMMSRDLLSASPVCTDTTAPAGITFFTPYNSVGDADLDFANGRPIGPLNTDSDGSTDLTQDDTMVTFLYIRIVSTGASGTFTDGVDNLIGSATSGIDSI